MKQRSLYLLFSVLLLPLLAIPAASALPLLGGWEPIEDINDSHIQEIGEFAVSQYNKQSKAELKFEKVVKGETQVVAGMNYRLILGAKNGTIANNYEAVVWEKLWENFKDLTSFKPVKN